MWQLSNVLRRAADGGIPPVMDSRAATEGGPYLGFVGAALRGGPALVRHIRSATIFCTSSYVAVSARNPSRATVLGLSLHETVRHTPHPPASRRPPRKRGGEKTLMRSSSDSENRSPRGLSHPREMHPNGFRNSIKVSMIDEPTQIGDVASPPNAAMLHALAEIDGILKGMNLKPSGNDYLRETRGGAMYGIDDED
jgi:hypothetical protein